MHRHASNRRQNRTIATLLLFMCLSIEPAFAVTVTVPGQANPYLSGMPAGSTCCASDTGADSVPAQSPVQVTGLTLTAGAVLTFDVTGAVNNAGASPVDPADGSVFFAILGGNGTPSRNGIAGVNAPLNALVGVFLDDSLPTSS